MFAITEECIACDACKQRCPVRAVTAADPIYLISSEICHGCNDFDEPLCIAVCPVDSIEPLEIKLQTTAAEPVEKNDVIR